MNYIARAEQYMDDVLSGKELVCDYVRKAVERHQNDLLIAPEKGWIFKKDEARAAMKFFEKLEHTKGRRWARKPFVLEPWQCFIIYCVFGWYTSNGYRRFTKVYGEVSKKNGKTALAAGVADLLLLIDDEPEAEVYCAATKKEQAKLCFNQAKNYLVKSKGLASIFKPKYVTNNVSIPTTGSKMEPLGRDSLGLDGINPSGAIIDEYHEWKTDDVRDSIESAMVSRLQTLLFIITTAGFNKNGPCFTYRKMCIDILNGIKIQDDTFVIIFTLDEGDDWKDETIWKKACPNLGVSVEIDKMRSEFEDAINRGGRKEVSFKTKNLNMWVDAPTVWIKDEFFKACAFGTKQHHLEGYPCFAGLDLASRVDINALVLYFPETGNLHPETRKPIPAYKAWFWVPERKVEEREDRVDYAKWISEGHMTTFDGDILDDLQMVEDLLLIFSQYNVKNLSYDPHKAHGGIIQGLLRANIYAEDFFDPYSQSITEMSEPSKELEAQITGKKVEFFNNPVMRWMLGNVVVYTDPNDNIKLHKGKSQDKIDGIVAAAIAVGGYMSSAATQTGWGTVDFA